MKTIEIYGQDRCRFCSDAKNLALKLGYPFVYRDIRDPLEKHEMFERNPEAKTVPQIFIGETLVGGYDEFAALPTNVLQQMLGE